MVKPSIRKSLSIFASYIFVLILTAGTQAGLLSKSATTSSLSSNEILGRPIDEPARGFHGVVASQHQLASRIGIDVLKKGGNAIDAAVAVGLALAVVYPEAGNIGGGGFMLIRKADGTSTVIDYRETAPQEATHDMFIDKEGKLIRGEGSSTVGYRASAVPGTVAGFELALNKYGSGKLKWADLVRPARLLARDGYTLSYRLANQFVQNKKDLSKYP